MSTTTTTTTTATVFSQGRKISNFPANTELPADTFLSFISDSVNYKITLADFLSALNVTGSIVSIGTGQPVLDVSLDVNQIRSIIAGSGAIVTTDLNDNIEIAFQTITEEVSAYTITGSNEVVICSGSTPFQVDLKASPDLGDQATVIRAGTANITIDGNGLNIIGSGTQVLSAQYDFFNTIASSTEWLER